MTGLLHVWLYFKARALFYDSVLRPRTVGALDMGGASMQVKDINSTIDVNLDCFFILNLMYCWSRASNSNKRWNQSNPSWGSFSRQRWRSRPICSWRGCLTRTRLRFDRSSSAASLVSSICEMPTTLIEHRVKRLPPGGRDQPGLPRTWHRAHIQVKPITSCEKSPLLYKTFHFQNLCDNFPWLWSKWGSCSPS